MATPNVKERRKGKVERRLSKLDKLYAVVCGNGHKGLDECVREHVIEINDIKQAMYENNCNWLKKLEEVDRKVSTLDEKLNIVISVVAPIKDTQDLVGKFRKHWKLYTVVLVIVLLLGAGVYFALDSIVNNKHAQAIATSKTGKVITSIVIPNR